MLKNTDEDRRNKKLASQKCVRQWANSTLETERAMAHALSSALQTNAAHSTAWHWPCGAQHGLGMLKQACLHGQQAKAAALRHPRGGVLTQEPHHENPRSRCQGEIEEHSCVLPPWATLSVVRVGDGEQRTINTTGKGSGSLHKQPTLVN